MKISVSMITMNEEKNIVRALSSCSFADEIVVVDGGSADRTIDILRSFDKVVLIQHPWENHFGRQRQVSLEHCTGDWVIRLDSDEAFSREFEENIRRLLSSTSADITGYKIHQCNLVGNEKYYSKNFDDYENIPRIWRNLPGLKWEHHIHEILTGFSGVIKLCDTYVVHYGFLDKKRYWQKSECYSQVPESGFRKPDELYYREYDIQPRPLRAAVSRHVTEYMTEEFHDGPPGIAIVMGSDMNDRETWNFGALSDKFNITLYSSDRANIDLTNAGLPVIKLPSDPGDSAIMKGLEFELFDKDIVCSEGITSVFTYQAVVAKLKFGKRVIALARENVPFALEDKEVVPRIKELNMRFVDVFVAVSKRAKEALLLEGAPDEKIVIIPMETDIMRSRPDKEGVVEDNDLKKTAQRFEALFRKIFQSTFKGAVIELAEYTQLPEKDVLKRIRSVYSQQVREWEGIIGKKITQDKVEEFYSDTESYLYDLVQYNYENPNYIQWAEDILNFCARLKKAKGDLKVLDFGGGIGSQLIALSVMKDAELSYADIPGKTFEYAKWRFNRRHLDVDMIDAGKEDFLGEKTYDVVIALDVVEHLVDPKAAVEYLTRHITPDGCLIIVTSFVDNNGEAGWHLNVDKYTDEAFYDFIKTLGMETLNNELPRIFQKDEELVALIDQINSSVGEGRFADSGRYMESYLQLRPVDLDMLVKYADVCLMLGDRDTALENLDRALLFNPGMPEALESKKRITQSGTSYLR